ncbi:MAG: ATP-binding protein [Tomitella sp.]|nr:ATP-binding protein [Tomitella sp.]
MGTSPPTLLLIAGHAGVGKSTIADAFARTLAWPVCDKDRMCGPLASAMARILTGDPDDRHSSSYRTQVQPYEYECLLATAWANLSAGLSTIGDAPFTQQLHDPGWLDGLRDAAASRGAQCTVVWARCGADVQHARIAGRGARRDTWKLAHWGEYRRTLPSAWAPPGVDYVIDTTLNTRMSLQRRAQRLAESVGGLAGPAAGSPCAALRVAAVEAS